MSLIDKFQKMDIACYKDFSFCLKYVTALPSETKKLQILPILVVSCM